MNGDAAIGRIVDQIEIELSKYYGFLPLARASHHVISDGWVEAAIKGELLRLDHPAARGSVYVASDLGSDEIYIGIHLSDSICHPLRMQDPLANLTDTNLDEFCVIVEEVSHFHLIANRTMVGRSVSRLELEFQAEIDKVIVAATFLLNQVGDSHLRPLVNKLFDQSRIIAEGQEHYWEASKFAARFWYQHLRRTELLTDSLQTLLRRHYDAPIADRFLDIA
ncbi:MAG: hypothetical protein FJ146_04725 [Deltaproteobacteria bacterium]|nr:hypothetical protein [Deltaproteobacteria bacterium]